MASRFAQLHGQITGSGTRVIVLAHGFGTDQSAWNGLRPWLDQHFRVVSFDLAGAGPEGFRTYDRERYGSLFGYVDDLLEILREQDIQRCIYLGHSVSCMIGAAAAVAQPDPFERLIMLGGSPRYLNDDPYVGGFEQSDLDGLYDGMAANFQAWGAGFVPAVVGVPDNEAVDEFCRTLFLMRPDIALATSRTIFQSDMRSLAARLERPTHILQTRKDMAVPLAVAQWLERHIEHATLDVIDAEGHVPHMTAAAEVRRALESRLFAPARAEPA
ncbi:MAG TPA: alpha/beta hydrolase [Xanthobacteraceae bacterium]|nr:alpha/beta hydrolase [Xanthobacteraceae bacterium]